MDGRRLSERPRLRARARHQILCSRSSPSLDAHVQVTKCSTKIAASRRIFARAQVRVRLHHHVLRRRAVPRLASPHRNPCRHSFPTVQKNKKCKTKSIATTPNSDSRFVCSTAGCTVPNAVGCANGGLQTPKRVQPYRSQSTWTNRSTSSNRCRLDWRLRMQLQSRPTQFK